MAVKKGTTKRIDGKLMRWNGKKWVKSLRKVGGELTKRKSSALAKKPPSAITKAKSSAITKATKPGALTKQKSRAITNRRGRIVRSDTANTSRDTVRGSGTRTGQPGKNRKLLKAGKEKIQGRYRAPKVPKVKRTKLDRVKTKAKVVAKKGVKTAKRAATNVKQRVASNRLLNTRLRPGMSQAQNTARTTNWLRQNLVGSGKNFSKLGILGKAKGLVGPGFLALEGVNKARKIFNRNDNLLLSVANLAQIARGKRSFGNSPLAQLRNEKLDRDAYLADTNKAPGAIEDFDQLTPAQMAEVQAGLSSGTTSPNAPPLTHAEMRAELERDFPLPTKSKNIVKKKEVKKKKKKTAKELWIDRTRNSPAALSGAFTDDERWALQQNHQAWRKRTGRA